MLPCSRNVYDTNCPTRHVLNVMVDKWAALIVGLLGRQTMRFTELHRQIGGISQKMLTQTLRHLERDGLVQRTVYAEVPPRVEYALTPLGRSLRELIAPIRAWSNVHVKDIIAAQQQYDTQAWNEKKVRHEPALHPFSEEGAEDRSPFCNRSVCAIMGSGFSLETEVQT